DGTINSSYREMLIGILDKDEETGRTTVLKPFQVNSRGITRTRGSSTQGFPKKSYRIEFQDEDEEDRVLKPLGLPAESDWILSGRYEEDRSLIRNEFTYTLSRQIGRYAARTVFCEVYVHSGDGPVTASDYVGAYSLMENMKRDADRIDIDEVLPENDGEPEISGGYIFKVDRSGPNDTSLTAGTQGINITEPSRDELTTAQRDYLKGYLDDMQRSFSSSDPETGYPAFIDEGSWIDHHLINMLMLNVDSLRLSTYFYKERNGKVFGGPVWDFNISSGSRDRFGSPPRPSVPDVWRGISGDRGTTFFTNGTQRWWGDLFELRDFQQAYCDRWNELRQGPFSTESLHALIDSMADELREAQPRNQARWPEVSPEYGGFQGEIDHLKDWLAERGEFVDNELVAVPRVTPSGGSVTAETSITMRSRRGTLFNPTSVYYTTDGSDPRLPGGEINPEAIEYQSGFTLAETTIIRAREYMPNYNPERDGPDQQWSAMGEYSFVVGTTPAASGNLIVSEIMYHPSNPTEEEEAAGFTNDDDFEFLEFTNAGETSIELLGVRFDDGLQFEFEMPTQLAPGASAVIVADLEAFRMRYGDDVPVIGTYGGNLRNSGDSLSILSALGEPILAFTYDDRDPWPTSADGDGFSLTLNEGDPNEAASWLASTGAGGTPGTTGPPVIGETQTYAQWAETALNGESMNGEGDDPDGDGMTNLAEFALAGDPLVAGTSGVTVRPDVGTLFAITFDRRARTEGVTIVAQRSVDLTTWEDEAPAASTLVGDDQVETVTWIFSRGAERGFIRLVIR
ncbi:MAG: CotH kinase family protein, partial [Verrucomicrobiota bacterium]